MNVVCIEQKNSIQASQGEYQDQPNDEPLYITSLASIFYNLSINVLPALWLVSVISLFVLDNSPFFIRK